ncbi:MAG: anaerobic nitric oxide reductase flavorubredoxin [Peptococcaceae bacterium]|nr:anaerobic nitric oxide reductase flavorubredoxin [Peptococcaceae bacterium]
MLKIKDDIYWTGVKDWELKKFHGEELSTHRGSTYNSFLIKDKKTVLVDTVWTPFKEKFVEKLDREVGLGNISAIVINHVEQDHGGSLGFLMEKIPNTPIYCSKNGAMMIKKHFHQDWNFNVVKTGDILDIGKNKLIFVEMPMLHWPDSMATYVTGSNVLLSNDAFGQHYATPYMYNDQVDQCELFQEALKYYANILTPYSKLVKQKINEIIGLNLKIDMIAPSHGIIWRENPMQIVEKYSQWASEYQEDTIIVLYNTMWGATKNMAGAITKGLEGSGLAVKMFNIGKVDKNDIITEIFKSKGIIMGCSTENRGVLSDTAALLEVIRGLQFKNKVAASFASYGWSGESVKVVEEKLKVAGFEIVLDGIKVQYEPSLEDLEKCQDFGREFASKL